MCPSAIAGSAPTKSGKNDDEGNQVEDGGNNREDHLNLQKGERKFDLSTHQVKEYLKSFFLSLP